MKYEVGDLVQMPGSSSDRQQPLYGIILGILDGCVQTRWITPWWGSHESVWGESIEKFESRIYEGVYIIL